MWHEILGNIRQKCEPHWQLSSFFNSVTAAHSLPWNLFARALTSTTFFINFCLKFVWNISLHTPIPRSVTKLWCHCDKIESCNTVINLVIFVGNIVGHVCAKFFRVRYPCFILRALSVTRCLACRGLSMLQFNGALLEIKYIFLYILIIA